MSVPRHVEVSRGLGAALGQSDKCGRLYFPKIVYCCLLFPMLSPHYGFDTLPMERWNLCFFPLNLWLLPCMECSRSDTTEAKLKKDHAHSALFSCATCLWIPVLLCKMLRPACCEEANLPHWETYVERSWQPVSNCQPWEGASLEVNPPAQSSLPIWCLSR